LGSEPKTKAGVWTVDGENGERMLCERKSEKVERIGDGWMRVNFGVFGVISNRRLSWYFF